MTMPARMLRLLSLLQSRREWSGAELAARLGVTDRTVRRDVDRLRELGYPVDASPGTGGGYRLASGRDLPPLVLDDDEAVAVAAGLLTAAGGGLSGIRETSVRALAKLEQVLPTRLRQRVAAVTQATSSVVLWDGPRADPATLAVVAAACRDHEVLSFDYASRDGASTARRVEPHHVVTVHGRWYLIAHDPERADWRTFRVDRITAPAPTHRRFTPRPVPGGDPAAYLDRTLAAAPYRYDAEATVDAPAEVVLARMIASSPSRIEALGERRCRVRLGADSLEIVAQRVVSLLALGVEVTLDGPAEVLDHLDALGRRISQVATGTGAARAKGRRGPKTT
ncbi:helix-turn-helix transcriptional regulator [Streptoalloteichus hindustanus]|uniref:Predicted DNA-binding transcriptional regulator YafY, contains an HTH and WYL domains n=1 Tax=Streptoalloteichus hindustanus TaxID=2017 RepID=A0A1M5ELR7_STRHI|nr:Predicted DNA-binding transcriptional regulator YafY, contains an HTH and WYL domains [Streptoalloteichus hindustanus]